MLSLKKYKIPSTYQNVYTGIFPFDSYNLCQVFQMLNYNKISICRQKCVIFFLYIPLNDVYTYDAHLYKVFVAIWRINIKRSLDFIHYSLLHFATFILIHKLSTSRIEMHYNYTHTHMVLTVLNHNTYNSCVLQFIVGVREYNTIRINLVFVLFTSTVPLHARNKENTK